MKHKKNIWLMGGFGNNLFQYLAYLKLKNKGYDVHFVSNLIKENFVTKFFGWKIHSPTILNFITTNSLNYFKFIKTLTILFISKLFKIRTSSIFTNNINNINNSVNIFGYFQERKFLESCEKEFSELNDIIPANSNLFFSDKSLTIHFRWGDSSWAKLNQEYYDKIIKLSHNYEEIIIVTDDIDMAKLKFKSIINLNFNNSNSVLEDFTILRNSSNLACAPSTFSWWAAQLSKTCKTVYMPKYIHNKLGHYAHSNLELI